MLTVVRDEVDVLARGDERAGVRAPVGAAVGIRGRVVVAVPRQVVFAVALVVERGGLTYAMPLPWGTSLNRSNVAWYVGVAERGKRIPDDRAGNSCHIRDVPTRLGVPIYMSRVTGIVRA